MPKVFITVECTHPDCSIYVRTSNGNTLCKKHRRLAQYRNHNQHKMAGARAVECHHCAFEKDCRREIWNIKFSPFCFVECKWHYQFIRKYGKQPMEIERERLAA